jgi:hypothetical protein
VLRAEPSKHSAVLIGATMVYQAHTEDTVNSLGSEFVAQSGELGSFDEVFRWMEGVAQRHPLPDGKRWMICDEQSSCFTHMRVLI